MTPKTRKCVEAIIWVIAALFMAVLCWSLFIVPKLVGTLLFCLVAIAIIAAITDLGLDYFLRKD